MHPDKAEPQHTSARGEIRTDGATAATPLRAILGLDTDETREATTAPPLEPRCDPSYGGKGPNSNCCTTA